MDRSMRLKPIFICGALLTTGFALAQEQKPDEQKKTQDQKTQDRKTPDEKEKEGNQTYEGPSILSRDKSLIGERGGKLLDFRFYGEVTGIYDSGLTPLATTAQGDLVNVGGQYGAEAGFGVIGSRKWRRDQLNLEYKGSYRQYSGSGSFSGTDQFLNLVYAHQLKRRLTLDLKETVGTSTLGNGAYSYLPLTNTDLFAIPTNELFDSRTRFAQSRVDMTWQKSARLSIGLGGEGFLVRRASLALAGLNGYSARANVAYRLTRRQTVSASYDYTYYDFQRSFGNAKLQTGTLGYSVGLSRKWDLSLNAGGIRVETLGLTQVALDPAIAAIVGRNVAVVTFFRILYAPEAEMRLIRRFDRSALTIGYALGVVPGNGVYLTSKQNAASAGYSYTGYRRLSVGANASYNELSSVGQTLGKYTNLQGGVGGTYKLMQATHLQVRYDYRHYTTQNNIFQKDSSRVSIGLAFSPGSTPLAIW
jgi:hypothetical protein